MPVSDSIVPWTDLTALLLIRARISYALLAQSIIGLPKIGEDNGTGQKQGKTES
jgi:hypothetical protein